MISVDGLAVEFGGTTLFSDISFVINEKDRIALMGKNGAGKSTLLKILAGVRQPTRGKVSAPKDCVVAYLPQHLMTEDGRTVFDETAQAFAHLHEMEAQIDRLNKELETRTDYESDSYMALIEEVSALSEKFYSIDATNYEEDVEKSLLGLGFTREDFQRQTSDFSGGWRMRIELAKLLLQKPDVLLLDEPLSALDAKVRVQLRDEIRRIQLEAGTTTVFVTHDQEEALTMSDRIVVMREGRIEQDGTPREIYEEPKNLFVAGFIGEINMFNATVIERLDEQRVRANVEGRECNIYVNFAVEPGQKLHVLLRPEDLRVEEINDDNHAEGLIGYVRERNYKGMTLESVVELENGKMVMVSEFFNEDDPDFDHSLDQKMAINWVESWEVVLADEEHK